MDNVYGGRRRSRKETEVKFIDFLFLFVTKKLVMSVFEVAILGAFLGCSKRNYRTAYCNRSFMFVLTSDFSLRFAILLM